MLLLNGFPWFESLFVAVTMVGVNTLGYGEDKSWWYRVLVALALGVPFMILTLLPWPLLTLAVFVPLYMLSLQHNWMTWGVVESAIGATQGAILLTNITMMTIIRSLVGA